MRIRLTRVGQWTLVSAGPDQNHLLAEVSARIQRDHAPCVWQRSGDWLEADADLLRLRNICCRAQSAPADHGPELVASSTGCFRKLDILPP